MSFFQVLVVVGSVRREPRALGRRVYLNEVAIIELEPILGPGAAAQRPGARGRHCRVRRRRLACRRIQILGPR